jgi:signal transduction histidine kinase
MEASLTTSTQLRNDHESFVYMAAHDLRSPLMSVKGLIYLMQLDSEKEHLQSHFGLLEKSVDRMNQAISDIITHSQNGTEEIELESVDFREITEEAINYLQYMAGAESVRISLSTEDGGLFFSNRKKLISIFCNIISNAIRYHDETKDSFLKINVTFNSEGCQTIFEDNGIGIDDEMQAKVFDKFFLVTPDQGGSGIGLYTVKESIEKLGGNIHLRSKLGKGTTFIIQIPNLIAQMG